MRDENRRPLLFLRNVKRLREKLEFNRSHKSEMIYEELNIHISIPMLKLIFGKCKKITSNSKFSLCTLIRKIKKLNRRNGMKFVSFRRRILII